jgi:hypothetical protein
MEREKLPYVPPMTGVEALAMFGDRQLLTLEEQREYLGKQIDERTKELVVAQADPEAGWEDVHKMEIDLTAAREALKETNRIIRKIAQDFGNKRGPLTLH